MNAKTTQSTTYESVFQPILGLLKRLLLEVKDRTTPTSVDAELQEMLETLPLSTDDFAIAHNRMRNAQRYLDSREFGAALWELNSMNHHLQSRAFAKTCEPRRRLRSR